MNKDHFCASSPLLSSIFQRNKAGIVGDKRI
jgi:hypothetical protein